MQKLRLVHILVTDGAPVNEAAAKRVFKVMQKYQHGKISYALLSFKCCVYQANLCVAKAICQESCRNPSDNPLVCYCIRLFRYVIDQYHGELIPVKFAEIPD